MSLEADVEWRAPLLAGSANVVAGAIGEAIDRYRVELAQNGCVRGFWARQPAVNRAGYGS